MLIKKYLFNKPTFGASCVGTPEKNKTITRFCRSRAIEESLALNECTEADMRIDLVLNSAIIFSRQ